MMLQKQEPSQAEDLVKQYYAQIYRYCYMKTYNQVSSQDLTQEIFCRFFQRYDTYQKEEKIRQIIFTIAHNLCIDYYRKQAHRDTLLEDSDCYPNKEEVDVERNVTLLKIVNQLSSNYKETLILYFYYDFKIREIAKIMNTSVPNIKYRIKAGKEELKKLSQKEGMCYEEWF